MKDYKIIDNFLTKEQHKIILDTMLAGDTFPWYYVNGVDKYEEPDEDSFYEYDDSNEKSNCYWIHNFLLHEQSAPNSNFIGILTPILDKLKNKNLLRIKGNLYPKSFEREMHGMHVDFEQNCMGLLYYLNENNGPTILEDGTEVESKPNRALIFNASKLHSSTTCTDRNVRCNIIFNYTE